MTIVRDTKDLVRTTRQAMGLTLREMGELLGVTGENIRQWEIGSYEPTNPRQIEDGLRSDNPAVMNFWLDFSMIRYRRNKAQAVETVRSVDVPA